MSTAKVDMSDLESARRFSVAPMMEWTDRHCRYLHRLMTKRSLLFTVMVTSGAVVHGDRDRLLGFDAAEHPVAVQLGGSDRAEMAQAAKICDEWGYDEININVGCPSDRVKSGRFGACLMAEPDVVANLVRDMKQQTQKPITVKCRIGIDDQDSERDLNYFADAMAEAGVDALYVHARKAWLNGLSPKQNRDVPPLDYGRVHRLKERLAPLPIMLNGGLTNLEASMEHFDNVSGIMLGRAAYQDPRILLDVDRMIFGDTSVPISLDEIAQKMADYAERHLASGGRLNHVTRHMLGLANGMPNARKFRQILSVETIQPDASPELILKAFDVLNKVELSEKSVATA